MIKKKAILAFVVFTAYSGTFASGDDCVVDLMGSPVFTGDSVQPVVTRVVCNENEEYSEFKSVTYGKNVNAGKNAGSITVTLANGTVVNSLFDIKQKEIEININSVEKEKGTNDPTFSWTMGDIKKLNADSLSKLNESLSEMIDLERRNKSELIANEDGIPYKYEITMVGNLADELATRFPNYNIIVEPGFLTITKILIRVSALDATKAYGESDPQFMYSVTGNIQRDDYDKLGEITLARSAGENAGTYKITPTVENMETDDYSVSTFPGELTIHKATALVNVDDVSKVYGEANPGFTYKVKGLVGEDELKGVTLSCAKCLTNGLENVGAYDITASVDAESNPNYSVEATAGSLTVKKKAATVTVEDAEKIYGDADPDYSLETSGLVGADEKLDQAIITRAKGEIVGSYKVSVSFAEGSNPNYNLTVNSGILKINPRNVTLSVKNVSKKYGEKDPELEYTVDLLAIFDGVTDELRGVALQREPGEDAGEYNVSATVDKSLNPNYVVSTVDGKLTITANDDKIVVSIKGHSETVEYNGKVQTVKGYDISSNNEAYPLKYITYTGDATISEMNAGKYMMGLSASDFKNTSVNYPNVTLNITDGVLEIAPRSLVVKAKADTITYGDSIPASFVWTADSLIEGDELDNIHVSFDKTGILPAGNYALIFDQKNPTNTNYVVSEYKTDSLTVLKKTVVVTVDDAEKIYGDADPETFTYEVTGLIEGDTAPEIIVQREAGENVLPDDSYKISANFVSEFNENYLVRVKQGHFTILPYPNKISVAIFGDDVVMKYTGEEITVDKAFDVTLIPSLDCILPATHSYSNDFVSYQGEPTVTGTDMGAYSMGLVASDFVNKSPNFKYVSFILSNDGKLVINDEGPVITNSTIKGTKSFGVSSMNRRILVNGAMVGQRYAIHDMQGRMVRSGLVESANFEIPLVNAGVYMVRVGASAKRIHIK